MKSILITKEVAQMLRVSEDYVRGLIRQRKIKAYKEGRRGGFRIPVDERLEQARIKLETSSDVRVSTGKLRPRVAKRFFPLLGLALDSRIRRCPTGAERTADDGQL